MLVAVLACVTATILGVFAGVLRLSNNWLVSKLMSIYVEIFRNIPLLIWILVIYGVMTVVLPAPNAFRGDDATSSMFMGISAFTNRGVYIPGPEFSRIFGETGILSAGIGWLIAVAILIGSFFGARTVSKRAKRIQEATGNRPATLVTNLVIWFLPLIAFFIITGLTFEIPELKGFNFRGGVKIGAPLIAMWFALSVYTGAFIAENVRAGIQAVSKGQTEAAGALGIRPGRIMSLIILPQALRVIIPPMISNYLNITKNSSLAILVGYADVTATLGGITLTQTGRAIECVVVLMLFYLIISLSISGVGNLYNKSTKLMER
jgi:general L-amino acid transport system permease protein